jgi:pimeloyl-ACP methyl ester carboxylesterase
MWSATIDVDGPVHLAEWGSGPARIMLVHGLGGSHLNWMRVAPQLTRYGRVLALDLPGFGLTPVNGRPATVPADAELLDRVIERTCTQAVILVGNSMGGLIALTEARQHPVRVAGLVLVDSVLPSPWRRRRPAVVSLAFAAYLLPSLGRRLLRHARDRLSVEQLVDGALRLCAERTESIPADVVEAHVQLERLRGRLPENDTAYVLAAHSIIQALMHRVRLRRLLRGVTVPTLLIHGERDRLVRVDAARQALRRHPDWELRVMEGVGHVPMLESPHRFLEILDEWLGKRGLGTATPPGAVHPASVAT